jgi:glycosyltransferase involved in cell wall biosynthesis
VYERLAERGHHVTVFVRRRYLGERDRQERAGLRVVGIWSPDVPGLETAVYALLATIRALFESYDVMHYQSLGPSLFSVLPRLIGVTVVTTIHSQDWSLAKWGTFAKWVLRVGEAQAVSNSRVIIAVSRGLKQQLVERYGSRAGNVQVVPNGVSIEAEAVAGGEDLVRRFGLSPGGYAVFVGRLVPEKNVHQLIEAFHAMPELTLAVVGGADRNSGYRRKVEADASSNVIFVGELYGPSLAAVYANASVLINPSVSEGLPSVVLEGLAYGLPVILSDIEAHREIMGDGAVYFEASDEVHLREVIQAFFGADTALQKRCRPTWSISDRYDWHRTADRTEAILVRAAGGRWEAGEDGAAAGGG